MAVDHPGSDEQRRQAVPPDRVRACAVADRVGPECVRAGDQEGEEAHQRDSAEDERVVVAVALGSVVADGLIDYGMAAGASPIDAAARSTLDALNRRLAQVL